MNDYLPLYRKMAADGKNFRGLTVLNQLKSIRQLAHAVGAKTMLDYGCGAADAYKSPHKLHHQLGFPRRNVTLYDPSFPRHSAKPQGKFDLVVCSDVVEHIPEDQIDEFVKTLYSHAGKALWVSFCSRPAKKCFPGTEINLHCLVRPRQWWEDTFAQHATGVQLELVETV